MNESRSNRYCNLFVTVKCVVGRAREYFLYCSLGFFFARTRGHQQRSCLSAMPRILERGPRQRSHRPERNDVIRFSSPALFCSSLLLRAPPLCTSLRFHAFLFQSLLWLLPEPSCFPLPSFSSPSRLRVPASSRSFPISATRRNQQHLTTHLHIHAPHCTSPVTEQMQMQRIDEITSARGSRRGPLLHKVNFLGGCVGGREMEESRGDEGDEGGGRGSCLDASVLIAHARNCCPMGWLSAIQRDVPLWLDLSPEVKSEDRRYFFPRDPAVQEHWSSTFLLHSSTREHIMRWDIVISASRVQIRFVIHVLFPKIE